MPTIVMASIPLHQDLARTKAQVARVRAELEELRAQYTMLLATVARVKQGELNVQGVNVDLVNLTWSLSPYATPAEPVIETQANGAPVAREISLVTDRQAESPESNGVAVKD